MFCDFDSGFCDVENNMSDWDGFGEDFVLLHRTGAILMICDMMLIIASRMIIILLVLDRMCDWG